MLVRSLWRQSLRCLCPRDHYSKDERGRYVRCPRRLASIKSTFLADMVRGTFNTLVHTHNYASAGKTCDARRTNAKKRKRVEISGILLVAHATHTRKSVTTYFYCARAPPHECEWVGNMKSERARRSSLCTTRSICASCSVSVCG